MASLLQKALDVKVSFRHNTSNASVEEIELACAYARHEVTMHQVAKALGIKPTQVTSRMYQALLTAARQGRVNVK